MEVDGAMKVVYSHCCGLDVHKRTVVAFLLTPEAKEAHLWHGDGSDPGDGGLAGPGGVQPRGDGVDGRLLAIALQPP
jgi:hypothetical protein